MAVNGGFRVISGQAAARFDLAEAHRRLVADGEVQLSWTAWTPPEPPAWLRWLAKLFDFGKPVGDAIFWIVVVGGVAAILVLLWPWLSRLRLPGRIRVKAEDAVAEEWRPDEAQARLLLADADALAAAGRHEEAVHLLLRRSVADIAERMPGFLLPSLTSRDIAVAEALPPKARDPFARIARIAERAVFARRAVGAEGWEQARTAYRGFAFREIEA